MTEHTDAFADRVAALKVPEPRADREALLLKAGIGIVVLGVVLIAFGWYGASGTGEVWEQIPFALSGGIGGLAAVIIGSSLIMRYSLARLLRFWLLRTLYEHEVQTDRAVAVLERMEVLLGGRAPGAWPQAGATDSVQERTGHQ